MTGASKYAQSSRILRFQLFTLQNSKLFKTQNENDKNNYGNF